MINLVKQLNCIFEKHIFMKKLLPLLTFLYCFGVAHSQVILSLDDDTAYIDSIVRVTKTAPSDSIKCLNSYKLLFPGKGEYTFFIL